MAHWCDSCGQQLPEGEMPDDATWLGEPAEHQHAPLQAPMRAARSQQQKPGRDKRILYAVVAALAAWGLFVGVSSVVSPDDGVDDQVAADLEQERIDQAVEAAEAERVAAEEEQARAERDSEDVSLYVDEDFVEADADRDIDPETIVFAPERHTGQIERLQRELQRRGTTAGLAYQSAEGIVIVDMNAGTAQLAELSSGATAIDPGVFMLRSWAATYAIDPESLAVAQVVDDNSIIVTQAHDGNNYFVSAQSVSPVVEVNVEGEVNSYLAPSGYSLVPFDGLGLVAVPQRATGATLLAEADDFSTLSENRVVTANAVAILEQECANPGACALKVTSIGTREQLPVPASFGQLGDAYLLAPNGISVLRYTTIGFAEVYEADTKDLIWVGGGMREAAWSPKSDFLAWLDLDGDPRLKLMFLDQRDWVTIELHDLGAPAPIGPEVVVFAPTNSAVEAG